MVYEVHNEPAASGSGCSSASWLVWAILLMRSQEEPQLQCGRLHSGGAMVVLKGTLRPVVFFRKVRRRKEACMYD